MPGRDGTGPQGTGPIGRRLGPCRFVAPANAGAAVEQKTEGAAGQTTQPVVYGVGRGGRPRGCGMGRCGGWRRWW